MKISNENGAEKILNRIDKDKFEVVDIQKTKKKRKPQKPYTTSTLQQDASNKLGFSTKYTMSLAQQLFEGIDLGQKGRVGLITYMRTDATRLSNEIIGESLSYIKEKFGEIVFLISAIMSILLIILITFFIFRSGIDFVNKYGLIKFITGNKWAPTAKPAFFGIGPMIIGSIIVTVLSAIIAIPFGLAVSIFMAYYSKKSYNFLNGLINLMAAIPSIIYGFFAMMVLVPFISKTFKTGGMNMLTASILLAIMILPTMVNIS